MDWVLNIALSLSVSFVGAPELLLLPTILCFNNTLLFHLSLAYPVNFDQNMEFTLVVPSVHFCWITLILLIKKLKNILISRKDLLWLIIIFYPIYNLSWLISGCNIWWLPLLPYQCVWEVWTIFYQCLTTFYQCKTLYCTASLNDYIKLLYCKLLVLMGCISAPDVDSWYNTVDDILPILSQFLLRDESFFI